MPETLAVLTEGGSYSGPRVFLPIDDDYDGAATSTLEKFHDTLTQLARWGGWDKKWIIDGVQHLGYEMSPKTWEGIRTSLEGAGLRLRALSASMDVQVVN